MLHPGGRSATVRVVFVVDPEGVVRQILYYPKEIGRNIDESLCSLDALQTSDEEGVATPADWPRNDHFGDRVLLPPPRTADEIASRKALAEENEFELYDWWFTLRDLDA